MIATCCRPRCRVLQKVGVATESLSGSPKFTDGSADNENDLDGRLFLLAQS
jgi:hypothetical protein